MEKENNNEMCLNDIKCYKHNIDNSLKNIISVYCSLLERFLDKCGELEPKKDKIYLRYIVRKGVEIVNHVFSQCLIYTKNLELTFQTTQSAFLYYCEFMNQIGNENHSYLKLSVKDATLFVYKKTIFEINQNIRNNLTTLSEDIQLLEYFNNFIYFSNGICFSLIETIIFSNNDNIFELCNYIKEHLQIIHKRILILYEENNDNVIKEDEINICLKLCEDLRLQTDSIGLNIIDSIPYMEGLLRKFKKLNSVKKIVIKNYEEIRLRLQSGEYNDIMQNNSANNVLLYILKQAKN